jgi:hypothetical protein
VLPAVALIDELDRQIGGCERELRRLGAEHRYVPLLMSAPGIAWVLRYTIASEIGDIHRFASPKMLSGYSGLCPRVYQFGGTDRRGHLTHAGPKYLRWALMEPRPTPAGTRSTAIVSLLAAHELPGRRGGHNRGGIRWAAPVVEVIVDAHGRPDGPVRDAVLREVVGGPAPAASAVA